MRVSRFHLLSVLIPVFAVLILSVYANAGSKPSAEVVLKPRVPSDQMNNVKARKNPLPDDGKTLAAGKAIFFGKGTCVGCHGAEGKGNGELAESFIPPPRDFTDSDYAWQDARTDGEIFWAISNGTEMGMMGFEGILEEEEIWSLVRYVRSFKKK